MWLRAIGPGDSNITSVPLLSPAKIIRHLGLTGEGRTRVGGRGRSPSLVTACQVDLNNKGSWSGEPTKLNTQDLSRLCHPEATPSSSSRPSPLDSHTSSTDSLHQQSQLPIDDALLLVQQQTLGWKSTSAALSLISVTTIRQQQPRHLSVSMSLSTSTRQLNLEPGRRNNTTPPSGF